MTPKSWTVKATARRRTDREVAARSAEAAQRARRQRRRSILIAAVFTIGAITVFITAGIQTTHSTAPLAIALFVGGALTLVANVYLHRWLARRVGTLTAVAVMSIGNGFLLAGVAALPGQCPETTSDRCSMSDVATWGVNGMLLPVVIAVMFGLPVVVARASFNLSRFAVRRWRKNSPDLPAATEPPATWNILELMRPASKRIGALPRRRRTDDGTNQPS